MGLSASSLSLCRRPPELRVLIFGLDAAGKTSLLYRLKTGELVTTIPTIGFNVESVVLEGRAILNLWDVGGRSGTRALLRHYFSGTHGAVFVVDSNDRERLPEALEFMNSICESLETEGFPGLPIAVLCNKSDVHTQNVADTHAEVQKLLTDETSLQKLPGLSNRPRACFFVSAATGEGLTGAVDWLVSAALKLKDNPIPAFKAEQNQQLVPEKKIANGWSGLYHIVKSVMLR